MTSESLKRAVQLLKEGNRDKARELLIKEVRNNPSDITAWLWALEVAANEKEKRTILNRILTLEPGHKGALQYLKKLDQEIITEQDQKDGQTELPDQAPIFRPKKKTSGISGLFRLIIDWLTSLPSGCGFFAVFIVVLAGILIYFRVNTSFFGLAGANFDDLVISNSYELISSEEMYWQVQFEGTGESKYIGTVRHAAPIRIKEFAILTQDILVTTADFANPDIVETSVIDHKFFWKSPNLSSPTGTINLIHTIPANQDVYQVLLEAQKWDTIKITGREIYNIKAFQTDGTFLGTWQDLGCNTLLVESVSLLKGESNN